MSPSTKPRVDLFVRSLASDATRCPVGAVVDRLDRLVESGTIDAYDVTVWGDGIGLGSAATETDVGREMLAQVERFRAWAEESGVELPFEESTITCSYTDTAERELRFPSILLAEYQGDELVRVVPHVDSNGPRTLADWLDGYDDSEPPLVDAGSAGNPTAAE